MNKLNTDYKLRVPGDAELVEAFGSLQQCLSATGGDLPTILFYLANPHRITAATEISLQPGHFASCLRDRAAAEIFSSLDKPTYAEVGRRMGVSPSTASTAVRRGAIAA